MEFKGEEFIRNIEIEKEKAKLKQQFESLEAEKNETVIPTTKYYDDEPVIVDIHKDKSNHLDDILLTNPNEENKKKYIILAVALSLLFVLTIVIIRLISDDNNNNQSLSSPKVESIKQDGLLNGPNSEQEYQKILDKKLKKNLDIDTIAQQELPIAKEKKVKKEISKTQEEPEGDLFGMLDKPEEAPVKEPVKEPIKQEKKIEKAPVKSSIKDIKKLFNQTPKSEVTGSYVQVGAFTKTPNKALLKEIEDKGYNYIIHKMNIKGTDYNKVLIGPYKDRKATEMVINKIKRDFKKPGAYIMKLK